MIGIERERVSQAPSSPVDEPESEAMAWTSHPLLDDGRRAWFLIATVLGVSALAAAAFESGFCGLLSLVLLCLSLGRFFLPTWYSMDAEGVAVVFLGRKAQRRWSEFRRFDISSKGLHLSPYESPSALDSFRGLWIRFAGNREDVTRFVREHLHVEKAS